MEKINLELEKRISKLEKLVEKQLIVITNLENQIHNNNYIPKYTQPISRNNCDGISCDFPSVWFGTVPPKCGKCGKSGNIMNIIYGFDQEYPV